MRTGFILAAISIALQLAAFPVIRPDGAFQYGSIRFQLAWFDGDWRMTGQDRESIVPARGYPVTQPELFDFEGEMRLNHNAGVLKLLENIRLLPGELRYQASLTGTPETGCRGAFFIIELPVAEFGGRDIVADGQKITLSADNPAASYPELKGVRTLQIPTADGPVTLSGNFDGFIQDERNYGGNFFGLRLRGTPIGDKASAYSWKIEFDNIETGVGSAGNAPRIEPVDIRKAANMSWRDETPGDRTGGWTDQGDNDVRDIEPGRAVFFDVPFDLIDPAENGGKSCLVFAGPDRGYLLKSAEIGDINLKGARLYLFHGLSWAPEDVRKVADIAVRYTDGTETVIAVESNRDVCNWWSRVRAENALIAWRGRNPQSETTLYLSGFKLDPSKTVASLKLTPTGNGVWMVGAISIGDEVPALRPQIRQKIVAGKEWRSIETTFEVERNSALDFSGENHVPAGKYGAVVAAGDHFEFENRPGEAVRFYGVNLCWSAHELTHAQSDELAVRLARLGYNSVRIHHYDSMLTERAGNRLEFDPDRLDKLDYLIAALKKNGLYVSLDLFTTRTPAPEDVPGIELKNLHDVRAALPVVPAVRENWKAFARKLLTHRNAYTNVEWRHEPAISSICTVNENLMPAPWKEHPQLAKLYRKAFEAWCAAKGAPVPPEFDDSLLFKRFILELQQQCYTEFSAFLKQELGVRTPLTDNNNGEAMSQTAERSMLDYVDFHGYWEHPVFIETPWKLPHYYTQESAVRREAAVPRMGMPCRIIGKPYMVTEFDFGFPNRHRGEGGLLIGAYAGFQNWSGLYRFAYSHFNTVMFEPARCDMFDVARDPLNLFADRIGALMFRRFDAARAKSSVPFLFTGKDFPGYAVYPADYTKLGLLTGTGSLDVSRGPLRQPLALAAGTGAESEVPGVAKLLKADRTLLEQCAAAGIVRDAGRGVYASDTGEITLDAVKGTLRVVTAPTEGFVLPAGTAGKGDVLSLAGGTTFMTCVLTSLDRKPLADSRRMVFFALTDVTNTGITFRDAEHTILEDYGSLPLLLRNGSIDVTVRRGNEKSMQVHLLDMAGRRVAELPVKAAAMSWNFTFDNTIPKEAVFACELIRID